MSFNPIDYLYFNPELQAYSNVLTIEGAFSYHESNPQLSNLVPNTSLIPAILDPYNILTTNKDILPISYLNATIYQGMSNEGFSYKEIYSKSKFVRTLYQDVYLTSPNTFTLVNGTFQFTNSNINRNDVIKVINNIKSEFVFTVSNYTSSTISIYPHKYDLGPGSNYVIDGIKVIDPLRIAKISLVRQYDLVSSNQNNVLPESGSFNPALYKLLYQDAARLTDREAFNDYISKRKDNTLRFNNAEEFIGNLISTSNLKISGINNVITGDLPGDSNRLVTEYGIRTYTEGLFAAVGNEANFNQVLVTSNFIASGPATFSNSVDILNNLTVKNSTILTGAVTMSNSLYVTQQAYFDSNVVIDKNALVYGNLSVNGNLYNPRIGIGYVMDDSETTSSAESNSTFNNLYVLSNIGVGLSNPSYQLQLSTDSAAKPTTSTWTVASDSRLKENIMNADMDRCYEIVKNLPLKHYAWRSTYIPYDIAPDRSKLGWIAQDVKTIFPKAVDTKSLYGIDDCLTLNTDQIYATMYGCIQKLQTLIEALQEENNQIKEKLAM
jgi:hypothetical protein